MATLAAWLRGKLSPSHALGKAVSGAAASGRARRTFYCVLPSARAGPGAHKEEMQLLQSTSARCAAGAREGREGQGGPGRVQEGGEERKHASMQIT